ncbi:hypothetical protein [Arabiibacter massiliensis]|uniref:hypothetical protein n=1 Tax=Arabiibacter massiliensis TaxID=1870985 RepID=UPI0009B96BF3|nr:hypothetical protein [Arabiibacter massiliensis]
MSDGETIDVRDLIRSDDVIAFVIDHVGSLMPWSRFREEPMPAGLAPETMWEIVEFIRLTGSSFQMPASRTPEEPREDSNWYSVSSEMSALLTRLLYRSRAGGTLSARLVQYRDARADHPFLFADLSAAATRDGLDISLEAVHLLASKGKEPSTMDERVVANAASILESLGEYRDRGFDAPLYGELQTRLDEGCSTLPYRPLRRPRTSYDAYGDPNGDDPLAKYDSAQKESCLEFIGAHVDPCRQSGPSPILAIVLASDLICEKRPFPRWNAFMEIALRRLSFMRIGLDPLASVPFSRALLDWELGVPPANELPFAFGSAILHSRYGNNITPYIMQLLRFLDRGLDEIEREADALVARLEACRAAVENDCRLNHRQQRLLVRLVMKPTESIDSATYERENGVTLVTARADLKKLAQMGYLYLSECGKKQVFSPVPHLEKALLERG